MIAYTVQNYLDSYSVPWHAVVHRPSSTSAETAHAAFVPEDRVAKAVLLRDEEGYVLVVLRADRRLDIDLFDAVLGRGFRLASEAELRSLFPDCLPGAVPPFGPAYGVTTIWDESLGEKPDVWFEGGDHRTLVHMKGEDFAAMMHAARPLRRYIH